MESLMTQNATGILIESEEFNSILVGLVKLYVFGKSSLVKEIVFTFELLQLYNERNKNVIRKRFFFIDIRLIIV